MTKDQLNHHLTGFLKRNKCLEKFKEGIKKGKEVTIEILLKEYQNNPQRLISGSFTWERTKQGHNFWSNISNKWENYLNEIL